GGLPLGSSGRQLGESALNVGQNEKPLDRILKLPDVAGPTKPREGLLQLGRQLLHAMLRRTGRSSSRATGARQIGRLTNLMQVTVDTRSWTRYRRRANNPDADHATAVHQELPT